MFPGRARARRAGVVLLLLSGVMVILLGMALAFLAAARSFAGRSAVDSAQGLARLAAASGMEYSASRLVGERFPSDSVDPATRGDDWACRGASSVDQSDLRNPSYSHGESWKDGAPSLTADSADNAPADGYIDENGDGGEWVGAFDSLPSDRFDPAIHDRDGDGRFSAWSGRLRGGRGALGCVFRLRIESSDGQIPLNAGFLRSPEPDGVDSDEDGIVDDPGDGTVYNVSEEDQNANGIPDWRDLNCEMAYYTTGVPPKASCWSSSAYLRGLAHMLNNLGAEVLPAGHPRRWVVAYGSGGPTEVLTLSWLGFDLINNRPEGGYRDWRQAEKVLLGLGLGYTAADLERIRPFVSLGPYDVCPVIDRAGAPYSPVNFWTAPREVLEASWRHLQTSSPPQAAIGDVEARRITARALAFRRPGDDRSWEGLRQALLTVPDGPLAFEAVTMDPSPYSDDDNPNFSGPLHAWGDGRLGNGTALLGRIFHKAEYPLPFDLNWIGFNPYLPALPYLPKDPFASPSYLIGTEGFTMAPPARYEVDSSGRSTDFSASIEGLCNTGLDRLELACQEDFENWEGGSGYAARGIAVSHYLSTPQERHDRQFDAGTGMTYPRVVTLPGRNQWSVTTQAALPRGGYSKRFGAIALGTRDTGQQGGALYWPCSEDYDNTLIDPRCAIANPLAPATYPGEPELFSTPGGGYPTGYWLFNARRLRMMQKDGYRTFGGVQSQWDRQSHPDSSPYFSASIQGQSAVLWQHGTQLNCPGMYEYRPVTLPPGTDPLRFGQTIVEAWMGPRSQILLYPADGETFPSVNITHQLPRYGGYTANSLGWAAISSEPGVHPINGNPGTLFRVSIDWKAFNSVGPYAPPIIPIPAGQKRVRAYQLFFVEDAGAPGGRKQMHHVVWHFRFVEPPGWTGDLNQLRTQGTLHVDGSDGTGTAARCTWTTRRQMNAAGAFVTDLTDADPGGLLMAHDFKKAMQTGRYLTPPPYASVYMPERLHVLMADEIRLYGGDGPPMDPAPIAAHYASLGRFPQGVPCTYTSPLYRFDRPVQPGLALWNGIYPAGFGPATMQVTVFADGWSRTLSVAGLLNDLSAFPPTSSLRYEVRFQLPNLASGVIGDTPVFESIWFTLKGGAAPAWASWSSE